MRLETREDLVAIRKILQKNYAAEVKRVIVCGGIGCVSGGSMDILDRIKHLLVEKGVPCEVEVGYDLEDDNPKVGVKRSGCQGFCELGPLVRFEPQGWLYTKVKPEDCNEIVEKTIIGGQLIPHLTYKRDGVSYPSLSEIPFYKRQTKIMLENCGRLEAASIRDYIANGGYMAFEKALFEMSPDESVSEVSDSNLRGRGGGGFPTGKKWSQVQRQKALPKYIVCNGDEGDPGAFMDRSVMEGDPHKMIEGMMIAGIATGASEGYIYVRAEYPMAYSHLCIAIQQAKQMGLLGDNILGTSFSFHMHVNRGAGAFVCGEGSALTASIEGKRGMPRVKPPRTVEQGLFEKPTVLNNVETFANVPAIILNGAGWYKSIGPENSPGTKAFALTGNIANTGLIEVPMGTTLREIIYDIGGGIKNGGEFKAVQIGGPSGGCLTKEHLDMPLDFDSLKKAGAMIGSGGLVVMDSNTCMVEVARFFMNFTQSESCGKCTPCREGTKRMLEILENIVEGRGEPGDIERLLELADTVSSSALCGLGKSAPNPVLSTIKYFRDEYEAHIYEKRCPTHTCKKLAKIVIDPNKCKGCSACSKVCPVGAISGKIKSPFHIDQSKCIKCQACMSTCKFKAISEE